MMKKGEKRVDTSYRHFERDANSNGCGISSRVLFRTLKKGIIGFIRVKDFRSFLLFQS
ncbi:MAG: hypothetical protein V1652_01375 [bacterium]